MVQSISLIRDLTLPCIMMEKKRASISDFTNEDSFLFGKLVRSDESDENIKDI